MRQTVDTSQLRVPQGNEPYFPYWQTIYFISSSVTTISVTVVSKCIGIILNINLNNLFYRLFTYIRVTKSLINISAF